LHRLQTEEDLNVQAIAWALSVNIRSYYFVWISLAACHCSYCNRWLLLSFTWQINSFFLSRLKHACDRRRQLGPSVAIWRTRRNVTSCLILLRWPALREYMKSSPKTELCNGLHCRQRRNESQPHLSRIENYVKFRHVFVLDMRANRQTDT